jgi:hypothetical protein
LFIGENREEERVGDSEGAWEERKERGGERRGRERGRVCEADK